MPYDVWVVVAYGSTPIANLDSKGIIEKLPISTEVDGWSGTSLAKAREVAAELREKHYGPEEWGKLLKLRLTDPDKYRWALTSGVF